MSRASSSLSNSRISPSSEFLRRTRNPDLPIPTRFERVTKAPGSLEFVLGRWVEV